jgi:hypothetical protein
MNWQREMCGEVCRMDDRIAVVDDQGGWDVFDLGMNRLDGGEETDIETAKTRCEAWSKTSMRKRSIYYHTGDPMLDDLEFTSDNESEWASDPSYSTGWWVPNVTLTVQSGDGGETWDWVVEDRNTYPPTHLIGQGFPNIAAALIDFKRSVQGRFGRIASRNSRVGSKETRFDGREPYRGSKNERSAQVTTFTVSQDFGGYRFYMTTSALGEEYEHWWCDFNDGRVAVFDSPDGWQYSVIKYDGNSHDGESFYRSFDDAAYCGIKDFNGGRFVILSGRMTNKSNFEQAHIGVRRDSQNFANSPRVPEEVDSKDDEPCPLCGSDHFDGKHCQTCGYDVAPDGLNDIDIDDIDEVEDVDNGNGDNDGDGATDEPPVEDE